MSIAIMDTKTTAHYTDFGLEKTEVVMTERRKKQGRGETDAPPGGPAKKKLRVIDGTETVPWDKRPQPKLRVVDADERLTAEELKERFAANLDRLIGLVGLTRKDAAREVGIPYKLMRRLVSAGVSRPDERSAENLNRLAAYFALPDVDHFWKGDLLVRLLTTDAGRAFVEKFKDRLLAEREKRLAGARVVGHEELALLGRALGVEDADVPPLTGPYAEKVAVILASAKADTFRRVIDDYYELVRRLASDPDERRGGERQAARG